MGSPSFCAARCVGFLAGAFLAGVFRVDFDAAFGLDFDPLFRVELAAVLRVEPDDDALRVVDRFAELPVLRPRLLPSSATVRNLSRPGGDSATPNPIRDPATSP